MLGKTNVKVKPNKKVEYVEYIESTGTQYIDTGIVPNDNITVEIKTSTKLDSNNFNGFFGGELSSAANTQGIFVLRYGDMDGSIYCSFQYGIYIITPTKISSYVTSDVPVTLKFGKAGLFIDDTQVISAFSNTLLGATYNMFLCAINTDGSARGYYAGKIYYCKIYDGDTLIRDFKPAKDGAGVYCLYETVEKRYYYNQGTGEFVGGVAA